MGLVAGESGGPETAVMPLNQPAISLGSADDLLSQLAGEEIDRLLAESEAAAASPLAPTTSDESAGPIAAAEPSDPPPVDLKALAREVVEETSTKAAAAPAAATKAATQDPVLTEPPLAVEPPASEAVSPPKPSATQPVKVDAGTAQSSALQTEPQIAAKEPTISTILDEVDAPLPLYLRPLEWLNAPLAWCSPGVREALGKVAIVTLVNAIAVLLYIVLFR